MMATGRSAKDSENTPVSSETSNSGAEGPGTPRRSILKQQSTKIDGIASRGVSFGRELSSQEANNEKHGFKSMDTNTFLKYRQQTTQMFGLPSQFFQSRAEIRTWGVEDLTDPAVQPFDKESEKPDPFHTSLPGYGDKRTETLMRSFPKEPRDPILGPDISIFPPTYVPQWTPNPEFKPQDVGYDWEQEKTYKMDYFPYVNAYTTPRDPTEHNMYNQCYPYTAYPYGVPFV